MQADQLLTFGPYRFAPHTGQLWRGKQEVRLTLKTTTVLRYLVEHAGQVVTKEELFTAAWPDTVVSDAVLTTYVQEVRQALRDDARRPRYIETVHRRGFRFIGKVISRQLSVVSQTEEVRSQEEVASSQHSGVRKRKGNGQQTGLLGRLKGHPPFPHARASGRAEVSS